MVTLYRGVNSTNVNFGQATRGGVQPNIRWWQFWKGSATPLEHNTVPGATLRSKYSSWTTDPEVAENFALRPDGPGVVIVVQVPPFSNCAESQPEDGGLDSERQDSL